MRKRWAIGMLALGVLAAPAWAQKVYSTVPEPLPERARALATLNLRAGPTGAAAVVGRLARGDLVDVVACDRPPGWCELQVDGGRRAFASAEYLAREGRTAAAPPTHIEIPPPAPPPILVEVDPRRR